MSRRFSTELATLKAGTWMWVALYVCDVGHAGCEAARVDAPDLRIGYALTPRVFVCV